MARTGRPTVISGEKVATIVDMLAAGNYFETACAAAGVAKQTAYRWLRLAADADPLPESRRTTNQQRYIDFRDAVEEAMARAEALDVATMARMARGGLTQTTTTEKRDVATGNVLERTTKVETLAPNTHALAWRLERRFGARWGRQPVEISGPGGGPVRVVEGRAAELAAKLQAALREQGVDVPDEIQREIADALGDRDEAHETEDD